jgi:hypothetical protein
LTVVAVLAIQLVPVSISAKGQLAGHVVGRWGIARCAALLAVVTHFA